MSFRTALCDLLGIEYPIVQSGMGSVAGPDLAAEVSKAGGLGVLGGLLKTADQLRGEIRAIRALTDRPFGVNLWLHEDLQPPVPASRVSDETIGAVQGLLDTFRARLDLPVPTERPGTGDYIPMWAGQGVGLIHNLPGAGEVVEAIIREARAALEALPGRIR
jgi:NAD(P)H-dependent flavin oxidoreductase YrpB (nitropropane dioxygenase family)